jgi:glycosyltransferase involved in cell wall biosynthesis
VAVIGRHDRQKGLDVLLDTIKRFPLPHVHFHVVGEAVCSRTSSTGAHSRSNVTFHGWLDRAATADLLSRVDALVMPSRWEAFGLAAIEAMRAGIPVIASNRGALPEIVDHGVTGYIFDLDDRQSLGLLLTHLDPGELRRLGLSARAQWEKKFVADRMNAEIEEAYRQLVSQSAHVAERPAMSMFFGARPDRPRSEG